jgi:hypothetical protein
VAGSRRAKTPSAGISAASVAIPGDAADGTGCWGFTLLKL